MLAAGALGRLDAAVGDLETAVSICDANGARGYAVQARVELAAALARRQAPGDLDLNAGLSLVCHRRGAETCRHRLMMSGCRHRHL